MYSFSYLKILFGLQKSLKVYLLVTVVEHRKSMTKDKYYSYMEISVHFIKPETISFNKDLEEICTKNTTNSIRMQLIIYYYLSLALVLQRLIL